MRQFTHHTTRDKLLTALLMMILLLLAGSQFSFAQKSTVLIDKAIAIKKDSLLLNLRIKRFTSQNLTLELRHMDSKVVQRFNLAKTLMIDENNNCIIKLRLKFPPGDIEIILYNNQSLPLCNPRRQNTDENAKNYDPSKGDN